MAFLIKNIKPNRQPVVVRNESDIHTLAQGEQVVLDIRNISSEMFLQQMRGEITTLYVARMPVVAPATETEEESKVPALEELAAEEIKPTSKKSKTAVS